MDQAALPTQLVTFVLLGWLVISIVAAVGFAIFLMGAKYKERCHPQTEDEFRRWVREDEESESGADPYLAAPTARPDRLNLLARKLRKSVPGVDVQRISDGRILVVEDEADIRDFVALVLGSEGYRVTTAANGALALDEVGRELFDLILLDMRMPVMDGWTFARTYRAGLGPHAPIVVLTAARDAAERAAQISAEGYLGKPFDLDDLLRMVAQHTSRGAA